jgi:hypothetical protein
MVYTFDALRRQVLRQLDEEDDSSTTQQLASDYLNQAHEVRALEFAQFFLLYPQKVTFSTIPGQGRYTLNPLVSTLLYLRNDSEDLLLREVANRGLSTGDHNWENEEGSAEGFMFWGHSPVAAFPSSASVVTAVSTSASDTGAAYKVHIQGIKSDGDIAEESLTFNGTTPVIGTIPFVEILRVTKTQEFNGTLTLTSNSGGVTLLTLGATEFGKQYRQIQLVQTPSESQTLSYRFFRKPIRLEEDYDIPEIPSPYSQLLVWDACMLFGGYNTDIRPETIARWRDQQQKWEKALEQYLKDVSTLGAQALFVQNREGDFSGDWPQFGN